MEYLRTVFADGSRNAVYRYFGVAEAAPVTATLAVGPAQRIRLNDAAFAHIQLRAAPGTCISDDGYRRDVYIDWRADYNYDADNFCAMVPRSGVVNGIAYADLDRDRSRTVTVNITGR
jgi:hypothetical protein